jgi:uncharacterized protein YecE (DUF72 family)
MHIGPHGFVARVGTASWTDPTLLRAGFYPATAKTAEARLRFYAEHFNTVEVDSPYYALPSERNAALWAERTPADFRFNVKAFAWLTQHSAETRALPQPVRTLLPSTDLGKPRVRATPEALALAFEMFRAALGPLHNAGKLGCVLLQFPPWFTAHVSNQAYLESCRQRRPDYDLAVEFRHPSWLDGKQAQTLELLRRHRLCFVCIDAPAAPSIPETPYFATSDVGYVRLHGRNRQAWFQRSTTAAERFKYLYTEAELQDCAQRIRQLQNARTVYVIFNNCYADYGVRNAMTMRDLMAASGS